MRRNNCIAKALLLFASGVSLPGFLAAGDQEFAAIVHRIESHYHKRPMPFMSLLGFVANRARPEGVRNLKMAVFEDLDLSLHPSDADCGAVMQEIVGPAFQHFVSVWCRRDGEQTFIYARQQHQDYELLIVSLERDEACVIKMRLKPDAMGKWVEEPEESARNSTHGAQREPER